MSKPNINMRTQEYTLNLGATVKLLRQLRNMNQTELSVAVGVKRPYLSSIEQGHSQPSFKLIKDLASALRVPPALLLIGEGDPNDSIQRELQNVWGHMLNIKSSESKQLGNAPN